MRVVEAGRRRRSAAITGAILTRFGRAAVTWTTRIPGGQRNGGLTGAVLGMRRGNRRSVCPLRAELVDPSRELEVVRRQASGGVRGDRDPDLVPRDAEIGVVAHLLGRLHDPIHELDRADEVGELERLDDRVALALPALQLGEAGVDLPAAGGAPPPRLH